MNHLPFLTSSPKWTHQLKWQKSAFISGPFTPNKRLNIIPVVGHNALPTSAGFTMVPTLHNLSTPSASDHPFINQGDSLDVFLPSFWTRQVTIAEDESPDFKHPPLPLARIKKVMKSDPDVKACMFSPIVLYKRLADLRPLPITR